MSDDDVRVTWLGDQRRVDPHPEDLCVTLELTGATFADDMGASYDPEVLTADSDRRAYKLTGR